MSEYQNQPVKNPQPMMPPPLPGAVSADPPQPGVPQMDPPLPGAVSASAPQPGAFSNVPHYVQQLALPPMPQPALPQPGTPGSLGEYDFHRLWRITPEYRWWRPLPVAGVFIGLYLAVTLGLLTILIFSFEDLLNNLPDFSRSIPARPEILLAVFGSVAIALPLVFVAQKLGSWPKLGFISSVAGRFRWRWFAVSAAISTAIFLLTTPLFVLTDWPSSLPTIDMTPSWLVLTVILFLTIPFQTAAEEYVFRGFLMQAVGGWLKHPVWAIAIQVPLFVVAHAYGGWAMADVGIFALIAGIVTWRTGGLESAVALHMVNNLSSAVIVLFIIGEFDPQATGHWVSTLISLVTSLVFLGVIEIAFRRMNEPRVAVIA